MLELHFAYAALTVVTSPSIYTSMKPISFSFQQIVNGCSLNIYLMWYVYCLSKWNTRYSIPKYPMCPMATEWISYICRSCIARCTEIDWNGKVENDIKHKHTMINNKWPRNGHQNSNQIKYVVVCVCWF